MAVTLRNGRDWLSEPASWKDFTVNYNSSTSSRGNNSGTTSNSSMTPIQVNAFVKLLQNKNPDLNYCNERGYDVSDTT